MAKKELPMSQDDVGLIQSSGGSSGTTLTPGLHFTPDQGMTFSPSMGVNMLPPPAYPGSPHQFPGVGVPPMGGLSPNGMLNMSPTMMNGVPFPQMSPHMSPMNMPPPFSEFGAMNSMQIPNPALLMGMGPHDPHNVGSPGFPPMHGPAPGGMPGLGPSSPMQGGSFFNAGYGPPMPPPHHVSRNGGGGGMGRHGRMFVGYRGNNRNSRMGPRHRPGMRRGSSGSSDHGKSSGSANVMGKPGSVLKATGVGHDGRKRRGSRSNSGRDEQPVPAPLKRELYKTSLCRHFLNGFCNRGATCNFAHGEKELRPSGSLTMRGQGASSAPQPTGGRLVEASPVDAALGRLPSSSSSRRVMAPKMSSLAPPIGTSAVKVIQTTGSKMTSPDVLATKLTALNLEVKSPALVDTNVVPPPHPDPPVQEDD
jgi:hypothetical protein